MASFTSAIKPYVISSLYEAMKEVRPAARLPQTAYALGAQVTNNNNRYIAIQDGITNASSGPSNATGATYDGTVRWLALGTDNVQDGDVNSNIYLGIGRQTEWTVPASPDAPDTSDFGQQEALSDITALIKLDSTNIRLGLKNNAWETGTVYSQYDPLATTYPTPNYVIVSQTFVYKCLDNNNGAASVDSPAGTNTALIETADGYIWKYVGQISGTEFFTFGTNDFVPAPNTVSTALVQGEISSFNSLVTEGTFADTDTLKVDVLGDGTGSSAAPRATVTGSDKTLTGFYATAGGSNYTSAYVVAYKSTALGSGALVSPTILSGEIDSIEIDAPGSSYSDATVLIIGDGTGAEATATITGGLVTAINVTTAGTGYTWAKVFIVPGTAGGVAKANLSPKGGHGSNLDTELGISSLLISTRLASSLSNFIPTQPLYADGSFRQITLVSGVKGTQKNSVAYVGASHPDYAVTAQPKYQEGSGYILYIDNIAAINHTSSQEEVIKISISL